MGDRRSALRSRGERARASRREAEGERRILIGDRADGRGPAKARSRRVHDQDASRGRRRRSEDLGDMQPALLASGTAFDVDPGQPAHEGGHGFDR